MLLQAREHLVRQRTATRNHRRALGRKPVQTPGANKALDAVAEHAEQQIRELEREIARLIGGDAVLAAGSLLLSSVPGVGQLLAAQMVVLTEGFRCVPKARSLAQRVGIAPNAHESGRTVRRVASSRGYGSALTRKLLYLGARSARTHDAASRAYFEAKVSQGKPVRVVLNNLSNRLVRTMCGVLRSGEPYRSDYARFSSSPLTSHRQSG